MKNYLKHLPAHKFGFISCLILLLFILTNTRAIAATGNSNLGDSTLRESKVREVLLSQQLFMVKISPVKGKKSKRKIMNFKAELRDAFTIICYDKDKTITELDWSMCPNGKCPKTGSFNWGTPAYNQLDSVIAGAKSDALTWERKVALLKRTMKNSVTR